MFMVRMFSFTVQGFRCNKQRWNSRGKVVNSQRVRENTLSDRKQQ